MATPVITDPITTPCTDCDAGVITDRCNAIYKGCFSTDGELRGCYPAELQTCFIGGNICEKPDVACVDLNDPQHGAACYKTHQYKCIDGKLIGI